MRALLAWQGAKRQSRNVNFRPGHLRRKGEYINSVSEHLAYQCAFCGLSVIPAGLDPCAFHLVTGVSGSRSEQRKQTFFCHLACMRERASHAPFYIAEDGFSTVGDVEAEQAS